MSVAFGPGICPEAQSYQDDAAWTDIVCGLMFSSCAEARQNFHDDITLALRSRCRRLPRVPGQPPHRRLP